MTQFFKRGDEALVLDGNEIYTLERAVNTLAMTTFDDYMCLKRGEINSLEAKVAMEHMRDNLDVLNALSNALLATKR